MARDYKDEYSVAEWRIAKGNPVWGAQLLQVCLFRDKTRTGFFSFGEWKSKIGDSSTDCEEKLIADLEKKLLYFDFSPS